MKCNKIIRYKTRLVAQGFSQMLGIDYEETYSPIMGRITFWFLIAMAASNKLGMQLMEVVTAYLFGLLGNDIYTKIPEGYKITDNTKQ